MKFLSFFSRNGKECPGWSRVALTLAIVAITFGIVLESTNCLKIGGTWRRKERDFTRFLGLHGFLLLDSKKR
jgi:hypothetical protein